MQDIAKKLKISYKAVQLLHRAAQTRIKRWAGGPTAQLNKKTNTLECLRNRCHTVSQLTASINSAHKRPVSTSTVKRQLQDAGLLDSCGKKKNVSQKKTEHWIEEDKKRIKRVMEGQSVTCSNCTKYQDTDSSVRHGGGCVMVWGCFGRRTLGDWYSVKKDISCGLELDMGGASGSTW